MDSYLTSPSSPLIWRRRASAKRNRPWNVDSCAAAVVPSRSRRNNNRSDRSVERDVALVIILSYLATSFPWSTNSSAYLAQPQLQIPCMQGRGMGLAVSRSTGQIRCLSGQLFRARPTYVGGCSTMGSKFVTAATLGSKGCCYACGLQRGLEPEKYMLLSSKFAAILPVYQDNYCLLFGPTML